MSLLYDIDRMFAYHDATKHSQASIRTTRHFLDWDNMPNPFRRYEGAPLVDLPADPPAPLTDAIAILHGALPEEHHANGPDFFSRLFFYSAAISAWKAVPSMGYRYSLRVNPSSGNLHPTEFHFATQGVAGWEDGLYHYLPSDHACELRARGVYGDARLQVFLTSIAWREAWKYRSRAYRYCLHDIGHAWQSVALAARALGCGCSARGGFVDDDVAALLGVRDEWPMLILEIDGAGLPPFEQHEITPEFISGLPNRLSAEYVDYPLIDAIHEATKMTEAGAQADFERAHAVAEMNGRPFGDTVRGRRSALDFIGGDRAISVEQLRTMLTAASQPFVCDFGERLITLYVFAHRVRGLAPGLYDQNLQLIREGDQRLWAAALSLGQNLAANSCVTFSMVADLERAARRWGNRGYRYAHFQAGAIGQRFYVASEALGFRSTGIGAFYDDEVHEYLKIRPEQGQVIYHFASGYPVHDERIEG